MIGPISTAEAVRRIQERDFESGVIPPGAEAMMVECLLDGTTEGLYDPDTGEFRIRITPRGLDEAKAAGWKQ